ncbi:MAG: hypothetical protein NUV34_08410 [Sulfuricaulis sp.]|nr:hypothetical protein [Sulfuricaulis sp.]
MRRSSTRLQPAVHLLCPRPRGTQPGRRSTASRIWRKPIGSFLKFAQEFEKHFVNRGEDGDRAIIGARAIAWQSLSLLPPESLMRAGETDLAKHHYGERGTEAA